MTTRAQLLTDIAAWSGIGGLSPSQQNVIIRSIEARIARTVRVQAQLSREDLVLDSGSVDLPTGWLKITSLTLQGTVRPLTQVAPDELRRSCYANAGGRPVLYAIEGDKLLLAPAPTALDPFTADLALYKRFDALAQNDDTNWLLTNHYDLYLHAGCAIAAGRGQDFELVQQSEAAFAAALEQLHESESSQHEGGAPTISYVEDMP